MKIAYISPGSGQTFYCQNCFRDAALLESLIALGHEVVRVPMYLPSGMDNDKKIAATPVFYGAINLYLKEKLPFYQSGPSWIGRLLDSPALLNLAAKKAGSTRPSGLEEMTLSMLRGEEGRQAPELDKLIEHLKTEVVPDVVHLSNALLLGLARRMKGDLAAGVVCSLQDEDEWIDLMDEPYQKRVWDLMAERAADVDLFVTASRFYAELSQKRLRIPQDRIRVAYGGIDFEGYRISALPFKPPVIGYLCRMSEYFGFDILVDAFLKLKADPRFKDLKLYASGGYTGDDKPLVDAQTKKIRESGHAADFRIFPDFAKDDRIAFLESLTLLSVPVPSGEAFGAYQVEALAAGVPVVQPNVGCYPEFVEQTNGGIIYQPNTGEHLAAAIASFLADPDKARSMGTRGRKAVLENYSMSRMAQSMVEIYNDVA